MTMLRLSRADAVMANGMLCAVTRVDPLFVELQPLGGEDPALSLSHLPVRDRAYIAVICVKCSIGQ